MTCEECGKDIKGKPVVVNGILFYCFRCYYADEICKLKKLGRYLDRHTENLEDSER